MAGDFTLDGVEGFMRGVDRMVAAANQATRRAVTEAAAATAAQARVNARTGTHGKSTGHIPGTGPGPNVTSGRLVRSIGSTSGRMILPGTYEANAGSRLFYARIVEANYPFLKFAVHHVGQVVFPAILRRAWA